jgi:HK97 family phage prohead protease
MATATRPIAGEVEERHLPDLLDADAKRIRGRIPYSVESRDMGGWKEVIEPGALNGAVFDDLVVTVDHVGVPLGRYPGTLELEDRADGLHWSVDPPASRAEVREAVERGDLKAGSWRMVVGRDEWRGDVRHVHEIRALKDVAVVTRPAYEAAAVEYRSRPDPAAGQEDTPMADTANTETTTAEQSDENRGLPINDTGSLRVEERAEIGAFQSLTDAFRSRGFPSEIAAVSFDEFRAVTFGGTITALGRSERAGGPFGADQRYLWQVVPQISVTAGATSVDVFQQTARTLPAGTVVVRAIDAVTAKPEVASTLNVTNMPLKQIAAIETNIPNIYLERDELATVVETDLRLAINEGLDSLVVTGLAASGFQAPDAPTANLTSIRAAITTLQAAGYSPDTLVQTPASAQAMDLLVSGLTGGTADYSWGAGQFAGQVFGLRTVVAKNAASPVVLDSTANGRLYVSPISLARFEVDAGSTNRSNVRMEGSGAYGVERTAAAVRIAAS